MSHGQNLRDLLAPLGVYRWEGSFQWGELQGEGEALDQVAEQVALLQRCPTVSARSSLETTEPYHPARTRIGRRTGDTARNRPLHHHRWTHVKVPTLVYQTRPVQNFHHRTPARQDLPRDIM